MNETFDEMIRRYQNEIMQYAARQLPAMEETGREELLPTEAAAGAEEMQPIKAASLPEPPSLQKTESPRADDSPREEDTSFATLTMQVYTAGGALPVEGAVVTVTRKTADGNLLVAALLTDESGKTVSVVLPAPPAEESTSPGHDHPFAEYNVRTDKEGYYPVSNLSLSLFGGVNSLQPVEMIPIPERETDVKEIQIFESQNPDL